MEYLVEHRGRVLVLAIEHFELAATATLIALIVAAPLGLLAARFAWLRRLILALLAAVYTIPSLALLAFLIPSLGLGREPALVALAAYAQVFLVRNILAGLEGVDPAVLEAARGLGMTDRQVLLRVRLPLALPAIAAGVRAALVTAIALASVAAWIGAGGLGTLLFEGVSRDYPSEILAGAIAIVALAALADAVIRLLESQTATARARRAAARS